MLRKCIYKTLGIITCNLGKFFLELSALFFWCSGKLLNKDVSTSYATVGCIDEYIIMIKDNDDV